MYAGINGYYIDRQCVSWRYSHYRHSAFPGPAAIISGDVANPIAIAVFAGVPHKSGVGVVDFEPRYGCLLALLLLEALLLHVAEVSVELALGGACCCCCC